MSFPVSTQTHSCNTVCWDSHLTYMTCSVSFTDLHGKKQMWLQSPWVIFTGGQDGASDPTTEIWNYSLSLVRPHRLQQSQGKLMRNVSKRINMTNSKMTACCLMTVTAAWRSWIDNVLLCNLTMLLGMHDGYFSTDTDNELLPASNGLYNKITNNFTVRKVTDL